MTNEEAIEILQDGQWWQFLNEMPCDSTESDEFHAALDLAIAALERDRWIPVEERLPEEMEDKSIYHGWSEAVRPSDDVLVFLRLEKRQTVAWYSYVTDDWCTVDECRTYDRRNILAWRPLPEPYKEG